MWMRFLPIKYPHVWMKIEVAVSTSLSTEPSFAASPDYDSVTANVWIDIDDHEQAMEQEPLLILAGNQTFTMSDYGGHAALIFASTSKRVALRYYLSFDAGVTYEDCFWGEVDMRSIQRTKYSSVSSGIVDYEFTVYDKLKSVLETKTTLTEISEASYSTESVTTLYNGFNTDITSMITNPIVVVALSSVISKITTILSCGTTVMTTPFDMANETPTYQSLENMYLVYDVTKGSLATRGYEGKRRLRDIKEYLARNAWDQYDNLKEFMSHLSKLLSAFPIILYGGTSGTWAATLQFNDRLSPPVTITFAAGTLYLSETVRMQAVTKKSARVTLANITTESSAGIGEEISLDDFYYTSDFTVSGSAWQGWFNDHIQQFIFRRRSANVYEIPSRIRITFPNATTVNVETAGTKPTASMNGHAMALAVVNAGNPEVDTFLSSTQFGVYGKDRDILELEVNTIVDALGLFSRIYPGTLFVYNSSNWVINKVSKNIPENKTKLELYNIDS